MLALDEAMSMMTYFIVMRQQAIANEDWAAYHIFKREWNKWWTIWQILFYN